MKDPKWEVILPNFQTTSIIGVHNRQRFVYLGKNKESTTNEVCGRDQYRKVLWSNTLRERRCYEIYKWQELRTWLMGNVGGRCTVGLNDLRGFFQPYWFYDSDSMKKLENERQKWDQTHSLLKEGKSVLCSQITWSALLSGMSSVLYLV